MTDRVRYAESRPLDVWGDGEGYEGLLTYERADGWAEVFRFVAVDGRLVLAEMRVQPVGDKIPEAALTTRRVRQISPAQALTDASRLATWLEDPPADADPSWQAHAGVPVPKLEERPHGGGPRAATRAVRSRIAELEAEARQLGVRHHAKWIYEQLEAEGNPRSRATIRNDLLAIRRERRAATARGLPVNAERWSRVVDNATWRMRQGYADTISG